VTPSNPAESPVTHVHVAFFAPFRYQLGVERCQLELPGQSVTVADLLAAVHARWSRFRLGREPTSAEGSPRGLSVIVSGRPRNLAYPLHDGAEVSILGPMSGG
jgi:molybdopterin converting factor small subunit